MNEIHYDASAGERSNRKSLASHAKYVNSVSEKGVGIRYFGCRMVDDNCHTLTYFDRVVQRLAGKGKSDRLKKLIKETEEGVQGDHGKIYYSDEILYNALISDPIAKKVCEKQRYNNWQDIIARID